ncbi:alpha-galactosidase [Microlunatus capsulatus]|uniref:Alpha-galactosidase n=1 Tax=Microlunatus capsulatus TaxID=99117 RepID=A0ABS4Z941_9ACTN|nr:alpha-galactosidase [Microlunatus capsulatus]MBP2417565.1 alpha-galactosidase [Microlunatus capsulatus]
MSAAPEVLAVLPGAELVRDGGEAAATWTATVQGPTPAEGLVPVVAAVHVPGARTLRGFTSSWGLEFEPQDRPAGEPLVLEVTSGRSSNQASPWLAVEGAAGACVLTLHWSGNWRLTSTPTAEGVRVEVGLHPDGQRLHLTEGEAGTLPAVSVGWGTSTAEAAASLARHLLGQVPPGPPLLTEWNHWWPYEDVEIDEDVFLANAAVAADLGLEVAVLDAGWFGRADATSDWVAERGDWHRVNTARFPHGLAWLAEQTRARGVEFGIWVEAEAVGGAATVAEEHPELLALDADGARLGYVCLGSRRGREHVHDTVHGLLEQTRARWLKWDFNLDPGRGCARDDHGHRADDGLLQHYRGLYAVLDRLKVAHPATVLEACASGGLRLDAGLAAHVDGFFLSDPDWTEHHLAVLWGAARMLPPRQLLHWPQSEWRGEHRFQKVDYSGSLLTLEQFDTKVRAALLHRFGVSVRLTEMRPDLAARLREHVTTFTTVVRPLLADGVLVPLTEQPLREERGHRQPAFQLSSGDEHLVAAFRLPPTGGWDPVRPAGLDARTTYAVAPVDVAAPDEAVLVTGAELQDVGLPSPPASVTSALWSVRRAAAGDGGRR